METKFKEGDLIKMKQGCSGCKEGKIYSLHMGNTKGADSKNLFAWNDEMRKEPDDLGCWCQENWELVKLSSGNKRQWNTHFESSDGIKISKDSIEIDGVTYTHDEFVAHFNKCTSAAKKYKSLNS